jgi:hypothetical protein
VHDDDREGHVAVLGADEFVRVVGVRVVVERDDRAGLVFSGQGVSLPWSEHPASLPAFDDATKRSNGRV